MYKVILFNHGETAANGRVLLDTSSGENPGLTQAVVETKLNEAGSFSYAIVPTHPLYEMTSPLKVYVVVEEDGTEIFYGRIISVQINPLTKIKAVTCEGALAFLLDCELPKDSEDRESTAANYFTYCVNKYNEGIRNDPNRLLRVGTIDVDKASEQHTYKNGSYSQIQSTMKSQLLDVHDGFFRVRKDSGTGEHYIDWVKQVGQTNPQRIAITHNVISQNSTESGEDIFSLMRPLGNDDITIGENNGLLTVSQNMLDDYGAIIRSVNFDAKSASSLKTKALEYIEKIKNRLTITGDISFVDFHFLDGSSTKVHVGDVFTNIEGYDGVKLTAESVTRNLLDAGKDKLSIKNDKELMKSAAASGANSSRSTGTTSGGRASRNSAMMYKFYHETNTDASIQARNIALEADKKIELKAQEVTAHADQIDLQLSDKIGKVKIDTDTLKEEWTLYKGTEIYLNQDHIDQVCGLYKVVETKDPRTGEVIDRKLIVKEGTGLYQTRNGAELGVYDNGNLTGGVMAQKINGQTETLINGDRVKVNGNTTINDVITINENGQAVFGRTVAIGNAESGFTQINGPKVTANTLSVRENGSLDFTIGHGESAGAMSLTGSILSTMIQSFAINDNVLTLTRMNGTSETFSKATSLSGTWSGDSTVSKTLTVTASPQGNTYIVQIGGSPVYATNRTNLEIVSAGAATVSKVGTSKYVDVPIKVQRLTGSQSQPEVIYEKILNPIYSNLLTDITVNSNGLYNLADDDEHVGFSHFRVNVVPALAGTWAENILTVSSNPTGNTYQVQVGGTPDYSANRTNLEVTTNGSATVTKSGSTKYVRVPVKIQRLTGAQSAPVTLHEKTIDYSASGLLTTATFNSNGSYNLANDDSHIGWSSVNVNVPNTMLVNATTGTATIGTRGSSSLTFSAGITYSSATHTYIARAIVDGVDMEPRRASSGTEAYTDGKTYGHGEMGIEADAQNSLVKVVQGSTKSLSITIPNPTFNYDSSTHKYRVTMTAKAGDTTVVTATSINASGLEAYNDGWDGCVATKTWVGEASKTLAYDESVNVAATIKDKNGNTVSIGAATYVAPPDRYESGWSAAYGKVRLPAANTSTASATFEIPKSSVNNTADQKTYTLGLSSTPYNFNTTVYLYNPDRSAVAALSVGLVYNAGVDEGNKNRHSIVLFSETTGTPTITVEYGKTYKAQSQYQAYDQTWHDDYKEIFTVPADRYEEGYQKGKSEAPSYSHSAVIKCTGKVRTYPNSSIYNYTFTCDGASGALASVGDSLHVHW